MKNTSPEWGWYNAQGLSKASLLLAVLVVIVAGVGVFSMPFRDQLVRFSQSPVVRVAQIQLVLRSSVHLRLIQMQPLIELEKVDEVVHELRRTTVLDSNGEFLEKMLGLKIRISQCEQVILGQIELEKLRSSISEALELDQLDDVAELLQEYSKVAGQDVTYLTLKEKYDASIQRYQKIEKTSEEFATAMTSWNEAQAAQCLSDLRRLKAKPEVLVGIARKLDQLIKANAQVTLVLKRVEGKDSGGYSAHLLGLVESEIQKLGAHPKLLNMRKKLLSYPQVIRVPADVTTLDEAYLLLENGGTIELGEGVFYVELEINKPVTIKGAGVGATVIESRTVKGAGLHFFHPQKESKVSHLTLRGFIDEAGKYPLILLRGGGLDLSYVEILASANHGMAVSAGVAKIDHCRFAGNRWDGLAVFGPSSSADVQGSSFLQNGDHGVDVWGGAKAFIQTSRIEKNSKSGVVVSGAKSLAQLTDVQSRANRECGIYLNLGASLTAERVKVSDNAYSGLIAQRVDLFKWITSDASSNGEFGYIIDRKSMEAFEGRLAGKENKLGLKRQKRLK